MSQNNVTLFTFKAPYIIKTNNYKEERLKNSHMLIDKIKFMLIGALFMRSIKREIRRACLESKEEGKQCQQTFHDYGSPKTIISSINH